MAVLSLGPNDSLYYEYFPVNNQDSVTFVFFNALTSDTGAWETAIAPALRQSGHGTLAFNYRGQTNSPFSPHLTLDETLIVSDAVELLQEIQPHRPLLVGLSIGGLFAVKAYLNGLSTCGLVLINTLRKNGTRLQWIGDALVRAVSIGGLELFRDLYLPLLMNEKWQQENRKSFLQEPINYQPLSMDHGHFKLLAGAGCSSDWEVEYENLDLPCLVITGLQDHVFLELDAVDELCSRLPHMKRLDFEEAGHLLPAEIPDQLISALVSFAKEVG